MNSFLPPSHRLIVEFAALLLQLVVANVEGISAKIVVSHLDWILLASKVLMHVVILVIIISATQGLSIFDHASKAMISMVISIAVGIIVLVGILLIGQCHNMLASIVQSYILSYILKIYVFRISSTI